MTGAAARETVHFVIVGHVDHGKSTLIGRLLWDSGALPPEKMEEIRQASGQTGGEAVAHVMDQLEEERRQEMTIDTAQAFFKTARRDYAIIDAPGHRELTKNMVTGASRAEGAVLVVDAVDGLREQTRRHAYFLATLGIRQVAVLINKMDAAAYDRNVFERRAQETREMLRTMGIAPSHIIPGSARLGDNIVRYSAKMAWYPGPTVMGALEAFEPPRRESERPLRFAVQDVYTVDGRPMHVGRVEAGRVTAGQEVLFLPAGRRARVERVAVFGQERTQAEAGECIGLVLDAGAGLGRGQIGCDPANAPEPTRRFRASIFWMTPLPCRRGERLLLRAATQEVPCRVEKIEKRMDSSTLGVIEEDAAQIQETEVGQVLVAVDSPVVLESYLEQPEMGRFVLARGYDAAGGGLVTRGEDLQNVEPPPSAAGR